MPFTFKLSRRLARLRTATIVSSLAATGACVNGAPSSPGEEFQLQVTPQVLTLAPMAHVSFGVAAQSAAGEPISLSRFTSIGLAYTDPTRPRYSWSATGGIVSDEGQYAAGTEPGEYLVIVTALSGRIADTAHVLVEP